MNNQQFALHVFAKTRARVAQAVSDLSHDQLLSVPDGFANNILWNVGHMIVIQQQFIYGRSGLDVSIDLSDMRARYWANTSPSDWETMPDIQAVLAMITAHPQQLQADLDAGKFADTTYESRTSGSGIYIETLTEAIHYNNYHEGLHAGTILSLLDFVK